MPAINDQMNKFRLAGRGVFNQYFRPSPNDESGDAWTEIERFACVERALFDALVIQPCGLMNRIYYQETITEIGVRLRQSNRVPAMINRDTDSGCWDHPVKELAAETVMSFVHFFDWDQTDYIDYRYVRVTIDNCPTNSGIVGKHALIETQYIEFFRRDER
ncbi:MAG: hypothetical protein GY947_00350 [Rhodobacteraceae bacterium]|nr:hypothetical protein [Paracoccaceae bacterium]